MRRRERPPPVLLHVCVADKTLAAERTRHRSGALALRGNSMLLLAWLEVLLLSLLLLLVLLLLLLLLWLGLLLLLPMHPALLRRLT